MESLGFAAITLIVCRILLPIGFSIDPINLIFGVAFLAGTAAAIKGVTFTFRLFGCASALARVIASTCVCAPIVVAFSFYAFFGVFLDRNKILESIVGITSGEVRIDSWGYLWMLLLLVSWILVAWIGLRLLRFIPRQYSNKLAWGLALLGVFAAPPIDTRASISSIASTGGEELSVQTERQEFLRYLDHRSTVLQRQESFSPAVAERPHILLLHLESLRWDMLTPELMPHLSAFREQCVAARRCLAPEFVYSLGNNSGMGVFGTLFGLPGFFYHVAKREQTAPLPIQKLKKLGYSIGFYGATDWGFDDLFQSFFEPVVDRVVHFAQPKGAHVWEKDIEVFNRYLSEKNDTNPQLDYLVYYSTHYEYFYPPEFEISTPVFNVETPLPELLMRGKSKFIAESKNRYLNAVRAADVQIGRLLNALRKDGSLDRTILVIFGDHGEEFGEHGQYGHVFGLSDQQTRISFLMRFPGEVESQARVASLMDVMPTIYDWLGLKREFMLGQSLLHDEPPRDWNLVSMGSVHENVALEHMIITPELKIYFNNQGALAANKVTDHNEVVLQDADQVRVAELLKGAVQLKRFSGF